MLEYQQPHLGSEYVFIGRSFYLACVKNGNEFTSKTAPMLELAIQFVKGRNVIAKVFPLREFHASL